MIEPSVFSLYSARKTVDSADALFYNSGYQDEREAAVMTQQMQRNFRLASCNALSARYVGVSSLYYGYYYYYYAQIACLKRSA